MNRREALVLLALGATTGSEAALAQPRAGARKVRIAQLPDLWEEIHKLFVATMRERGWIENRHYEIWRSGIETGLDIEENARRVIAAKPDLILAVNTGYVVAALRLTKSTPIVMYFSGFPVEAGVAQSYARPGGNVTGNSAYAGAGVFGKLIQFLVQAKPGLHRVGVLQSYVPPAHPRAEVQVLEWELAQAARTLGVELDLVEIATSNDVPSALQRMAAARVEGLLITTGSGLWSSAKLLQEFTVEHKMLSISDFRWLYDLEPVLAYTPTYPEVMRQTVRYIDLILNGARPGELPIQQPSKFELIVNLKTARAMGLTLPRSLMLRADQVIE